MLFGELVPKNAALARPMPAALATAGADARLLPDVRLADPGGSTARRTGWCGALGVEPQEELASARSPEELGLLAAISARAGALPPDTAMLLRRTIRFGDKRAAEAMTPRVDVVALRAAATVAELLALPGETGRTRFPVYEETLDLVTGVAAVPDALGVPLAAPGVTTVGVGGPRAGVRAGEPRPRRRAGRAAGGRAPTWPSWSTSTAAPTAWSPSRTWSRSWSGRSPTSTTRPRWTTPASAELTVPGGERTVLVDGVLREDELAEQTGFRLPEGPYETLAGFLMARLGHIPLAGETVDEDGWEFTVVEVDRHRIEQVRVVAPGGAGRR